jgi:hypothetical protein
LRFRQSPILPAIHFWVLAEACVVARIQPSAREFEGHAPFLKRISDGSSKSMGDGAISAQDYSHASAAVGYAHI